MAKFTWKDSSVAKRYEGNPVLKGEDMPYPTHMVYNAGVVKWKGQYVMMFRQIYWTERYKTYDARLGMAYSKDGIHWEVDKDARFHPKGITKPEDPRLTVLDGRIYVTFCDNTPYGLRGAIAVTDDLVNWELLYDSAPDNRNMVIFPERVNGKICRLERPFPVYGRREKEAFDIWFSDSPDGRYWGNTQRVLGYESVPFCTDKIGAAGQPIKTKKGWVTLFHATHEDPTTLLPTWRNEDWHKVYCAGIMMLDLNEPWKVVGLSKEPFMIPTAPYDYETRGYRSVTIFPTATVLEDDGKTVRIYYGACDTVMALATAKLDDMIALCKPV